MLCGIVKQRNRIRNEGSGSGLQHSLAIRGEHTKKVGSDQAPRKQTIETPERSIFEVEEKQAHRP